MEHNDMTRSVLESIEQNKTSADNRWIPVCVVFFQFYIIWHDSISVAPKQCAASIYQKHHGSQEIIILIFQIEYY